MSETIHLGDLTIDVVLKTIKNVHLSVYPPSGRVRISAPERMDLETVRAFAISKLDWIRKQQKKLQEQERESARDYIERESHYLWGQRRLLKVAATEATPHVEVRGKNLTMYIRPDTSHEKRAETLNSFYRGQLKQAAGPVIGKWQPVIGVTVEKVFVQKMKTMWGGCNPDRASIRLNTDLAKKPLECLEFIVVHEMTHMLEPTHNARFISLMDRFLPNWPTRREELNRLPVRHENWRY